MPADGHAEGGKANPLDLAVIGNCRIAALTDTRGRILWWCFPRFDADPVFSRLLAGDEEKGFCDVVMDGAVAWEAAYLRNTAIVETTIRDASGNAFRITDFTPRFKRFERVFNPPQIFRRIEPVAGLPRIKIRVRPTFNYGGPCASRAIGSNHIRYSGGADAAAPDHRWRPLLHRARDAVRADQARHLDPGTGRALRGSRRYRLARIPRAHPRLLARLGALARHPARVSGRDHPRRHHPEAVQLRGDGRHHRRPYHLHPRGAGHAAHLGLPLLLAARRFLRHQGAQSARRHADDGRVHPLHHQHRRRGRAAAPSRVRHRSRPSRSRSVSPPTSRASRAAAPSGWATRPPSSSSTTPTAA